MKRISNAILILLTMLICASLQGQEYSFRNFGNAAGLSNLAVRRIYQDRIGFLWVSTENGIYRYDGDRLDSFGPAQGIPLTVGAALGEAPDGSLLAGGDFGLYRLRGNRFEKVPESFDTVSWRQGIQSDGNGHTYLGTNKGLVVLELDPGTNNFVERLIPRVAETTGPEVDAVFVDGKTLWYGCGRALCRMDASGTQLYGIKSGIPESSPAAILKDGDGNLWVRFRDKGIFELPAGESIFRKPAYSALSDATIGVPATDSDGRLLLPTLNGLLIQEKTGWRQIDRQSGLRGDVYTAFEDRQHTLWIGMAGRGLVQWRGYREWENYTTTSGLRSEGVNEIHLQADGVVWAGTVGGLMRGEPQPFGMQWKPVAGLEGFPIRAVRADKDGNLWLSTETRGVARLNTKTGELRWFAEKQGLANKMVYCLRFDRAGRLWAGTEAGLFMAKPPYARFARVSAVASVWIWAIAEDGDGTLWVGGAQGLSAFSGGHWKNFGRSDGLSNQEVLSLGAGANGLMWVGYRFGGGIDRVRLQSGRLILEKGVQSAGMNGLVYFLDTDAMGHMWAGTEHGVDVWDNARWSHYDMSDGLVWNDCNLNAFAAAPDGSVWIGTSGGLSHFKPRSHLTPNLPLNILFTKLVIGNKDVSGLGRSLYSTHADSLVVRYSALNATRENGVLFRYRLVGASSAWTETTQRELHFAKLAPGQYLLEVEAQDSDGAWSSWPARFPFKILPPWYLSWWFLSFCSMFPLCGAWCVYRWRMAGVQRRECELQRLMKAHEEIRSLAFYDPLTGLPNRRMLLDRLHKTLASCARSKKLCALLIVDLDNFKTLNDTLGHQVGDMLLQEAAQRLAAAVREADTVARLGGDEFVVMLEELSDHPEAAAAQAETVSAKILAVMSQPYFFSGRECLTTSSIGITVFGNRHENIDDVLQQADIAMYQAKGAGRNAARFFAPALQAAVNARVMLEEEMRAAIKENQFLLYYQPQIGEGAITGAEALVRWKHPTRGMIPPNDFIPLAEETGLILPLGDWVLEAACRQLAAWARNKQFPPLTIAVNISARQLRQPEFVDKVLAAIERTGADPDSLELELTESLLVENIEEVIAKMTELKLHGLKFSLDDFGTGYSSLSYLKRLPLDRLKIDRAFVQDILADNCGGAIAQAIVSLSRAMGLPVIAEGVENIEQCDYLAKIGCNCYQGFFFSKPVPVEEFEELLAQQKKTPIVALPEIVDEKRLKKA